MRKIRRVDGRKGHWAAAFALSLLAILGVGCGGGGGDDGGTDPEPCSITNVSTGTVTAWLVGVDGPANLRWDHTGPATAVKIELLKAGAVVATVAASTVNDGFFSWLPATGGQPNGSDFGLRVTALGETGCAGEKTGLTLTNVAGCSLAWTVDLPDSVIAGEALPLTWDGSATSGTLDLELWQDDLGSEPQRVGVIAVGMPDEGTYLWDPVDSFHFGTNDWFTLRLADPDVPGCEDVTAPFRMVDDENCACFVTGFPAGAVYSVGSTMNLDLSQDFGSGFVDLRLLAGVEPVVGGQIANDVPVAAVYQWVVSVYGYTGGERTRFRIKATDAADGYCVGLSDVFTIPE
jgi:hypothetical protein